MSGGDDLAKAAIRVLVDFGVEAVDGIAEALRQGRDPKAELLAYLAAENAARAAERAKFGGE